MKDNFGRYVRSRRLSKNIKLRDFAKRLDFDAGNWYKVEIGRIKPPAALIPKIGQILNLNFLGIEQLKNLAKKDYLPEELW